MQEHPILFYTDDDEDDLFVFESIAKELIASTYLFSDGDTLLSRLNNPPPKPSLVFVDLNMPTKSGYEIMDEMKSSKKLKGIPIIILSTAGDSFSIEKCRQAGASYYIQKPTSMEKLKDAVECTLNIDWQKHDPAVDGFVYKA